MVAERVHRRQAVMCRQWNAQNAAIIQQGERAHQEGVDALLRKRCESLIDLATVRNRHELDRPANGCCRRLQVGHPGSCRTHKRRKSVRLWQQLMQETKPLRPEL